MMNVNRMCCTILLTNKSTHEEALSIVDCGQIKPKFDGAKCVLWDSG